MKLYDIRKRRFDLNIPYSVVLSDALQETLRDYHWASDIMSLQPQLSKDNEGQLIPVNPKVKIPAQLTPLEQFITALKTGRPVTYFLGSQVNAISVKRSDFELKNWGIYHAHLDDKADGKYSNNPNSDLLFFQAKGRVVHLIDIKRHPRGSGWFDPELLEIIYRNWPWLLLSMHGIELLNPVPDEYMHELSKSVNVMYTLKNGLVVMPSSMGVATSGDSVEAVRQTDFLFNRIKQVEKTLVQDEEQIRDDYKSKTGIILGEKVIFKLDIDDHYFIAVGTDGDKSHAPVIYKLFPVTDTFYE